MIDNHSARTDFASVLILGLVLGATLPTASAAQDVRLDLVTTIGGTDDFFDGAPLHGIADTAPDGNGRLYIADGGNHRVAVFDDESGAFLFAFGREGEGPGEFDSVVRLGFAGARLFALDGALRRVSVFDRSGAPIRSFHLNQQVLDMAVRRSGDIFIVPWSFRPTESLVAVLDTLGNSLTTFVEPLPVTHDIMLTGNVGRVAATASSAYYAFAYPYRIVNLATETPRVYQREDPAFVLPTASPSPGVAGELPTRLSGLEVLGDGTLVTMVNYRDKPDRLDFFSQEGTYRGGFELPEEHVLGGASGEFVYSFVSGRNEQPASVSKWRVVMGENQEP